MKTSSNAQLRPVAATDVDERRDPLRDDPRWKLAQTIVAGPHFVRSTLLSKFLLFVVAETLEGRQHGITEHNIGVKVFGRPSDYSTDEDNIVRNYARQLRRRLADHFSTQGQYASMRIEIPVGGYIPSFPVPPLPLQAPGADPAYSGAAYDSIQPAVQPIGRGGGFWREARRLNRTLVYLLLVMMALSIGWSAAYRYVLRPDRRDPMRVLWQNVMPVSRASYIVPSDAGLNLLEDMSHRAMPLEDYLKRTYETMPTSAMDRHTTQDLQFQQYTDFASVETVSMLARLPEYDPQRVQARFPRDLRLSDLKNANAIIIGSSSANPWASVADAETNFGIVTRPQMDGARIVNRHPLPGERAEYMSNWNEPAHETFALILYQPNLTRTGHILVIEGLDVAGTQGAAEALLQSNMVAPVLRRAARPDGSLRPFEVLLRTTSIQSNAEGTRILAERIE